MPKDKDLKRIIRQRMVETGERYTQARTAVTGVSPRDVPPRPQLRQWVEQLAVVGEAMRAMAHLKALPLDVLRDVATEGMGHESWRVRRSCASLLDDVDFTAQTSAALVAALDDAVADVRRAVVHTLTCQHCKPEGCVLDVRGVYERMASDPSAKVRSFVMPHSWGEMLHGRDREWAEPLLRRFAESDPSARLREAAAKELAALARFDAADAAWRALPEPLRTKVGRHAGKWVGVLDGGIVDANRSSHTVRRAVRGLGRPESDAAYYFVYPTA